MDTEDLWTESTCHVSSYQLQCLDIYWRWEPRVSYVPRKSPTKLTNPCWSLQRFLVTCAWICKNWCNGTPFKNLGMELPASINPKHYHYDDVIMTTMASQITSLTIVYSTVYSDTDQRKHQSSASLAFVWRIHRDRWIPFTKGQLRGKRFHLMTSSLLRSFRSMDMAKYCFSSNLTHWGQDNLTAILQTTFSNLILSYEIVSFCLN